LPDLGLDLYADAKDRNSGPFAIPGRAPRALGTTAHVQHGVICLHCVPWLSQRQESRSHPFFGARGAALQVDVPALAAPPPCWQFLSQSNRPSVGRNPHSTRRPCTNTRASKALARFRRVPYSLKLSPAFLPEFKKTSRPRILMVTPPWTLCVRCIVSDAAP